MRGKITRVVTGASAIVLASGCAGPGTMISPTSSLDAPKNYRAVVAQRMRQIVDVSTVKSAQITRPHERFLGLVVGGNRKVVCVTAVLPNIIGMDATNLFVFYFNDGNAHGGNVRDMGTSVTCGDQAFTPFTELIAR